MIGGSCGYGYKYSMTCRRVPIPHHIPISEEQLLSLLELQFSDCDMADLLQVSPRTIRRRIVRFGLQEYVSFSEIDCLELDAITSQFVHTHPNSGVTLFAGFLRWLGV